MASSSADGASWRGRSYGNSWWVRQLIAMMRVVDVRVFYWIVYLFAIPPTLLLAGRSRRLTYRYHRRRQGSTAIRSAIDTWRTFNRFATVVLDRYAMYAGRRFAIDIDGYDTYRRLASQPAGMVQLSSHIGNYEVAGYSLRSDTKRFNALVYGGEQQFLMDSRRALFGANNINMICVGSDMTHLFEIDRALNDGEVVSMPADRMMGSRKKFTLRFLNGEADFPAGPFMTAVLKGVPVIFVAVMKERGRRYHITVRELRGDAGVSGVALARSLAARYRDCLEETVRRYPTQWYNFYEFWND